MPSENGTMALARKGMDTIDNLIWDMSPFHAILVLSPFFPCAR